MPRFLLIPFLVLICHLIACGHDKHVVNEPDLKNIDTNIVLYKDGIKLRYYQYANLVWGGEYSVMINASRRVLNKYNEKQPRPLDTAVRNSIIRFNIVNLEKKSANIPVWNRNLAKRLPSAIDTSLIIYDQDNVPLEFYQYFGIILKGKGYVGLENRKQYVWRNSDRYNNSYFGMLINRGDSLSLFNAACLQLLRADKVLVIKSRRKLYLQRASKTFLTFPCNLGRNPVGDKQQDGDRRTPEGLYTLTGRTTQGKYGKGYYISYPDAIHITAAKEKGVSPGSDLMIHGTSPERKNLKDWTNGCIALPNASMDSLFKYVMPNTPIEIRQ